ncbi:hypothetical protein [Sphingomonas sp. BK345]|uniref:hypothetical protein n=1 Tax=Sphingomonas sp. BK345 TaxID=2586980 RepID=UPI001612A809|nr:hypothetical protein [Sphingomonas sp. BK345]MBB3475895.1 uncharacterized protein involved in response to NO [Sphingomonas sp. BK345]
MLIMTVTLALVVTWAAMPMWRDHLPGGVRTVPIVAAAWLLMLLAWTWVDPSGSAQERVVATGFLLVGLALLARDIIWPKANEQD